MDRRGGISWVSVTFTASLALASTMIEAAPAAAQRLVSGPVSELRRTPAPALPETMETARSMAMGLGARASATSTSAIAQNAAGLPIGRLYHAESQFGYEPQSTRFNFGGSVIDSYSGPIAAGMNYRYIIGDGENGYGGMDGRLALALPIGEQFAIGLTGRYLSFIPEGAQEGDSALAEGFTFDGSVRVTPVPGLHIAALGYNLLDVGSSLAPMQVGGSISYTIDNALTFAFDGLADLSTFTDQEGAIVPEALLGGAAEYFTGEVPIRIGYYFDTGRQLHYASAGLGYTSSEFGIDISWRQQINGENNTWLLLSARYLLH